MTILPAMANAVKTRAIRQSGLEKKTGFEGRARGLPIKPFEALRFCKHPSHSSHLSHPELSDGFFVVFHDLSPAKQEPLGTASSMVGEHPKFGEAKEHLVMFLNSFSWAQSLLPSTSLVDC